MSDFISVYVTTSSTDEAETIARALIEERLVACVNILPGVKSIYRWQSNIEVAQETILVAKSCAELFSQIESKVKSLSSYDCPCIVAWPIAAGHQPYLEWIGKETDHASAKTG
jgi:periplasmic divalent cation tolerance protein